MTGLVRVYRLRTLLAHVGACGWWRHVTRFATPDEVLAWVNAAPDEMCGEPHNQISRSESVFWFAREVAASLGDWSEYDWWMAQPWRLGVSLHEAARFVRLWLRYADRHGLYEDVPAHTVPASAIRPRVRS